MKMSKILAVTAALGLAAGGAFANTGIFGTFIEIDDSWYQITNPGANTTTGFDGADLGSIGLGGALNITGASLLTFKNSPDNDGSGTDVTGAFFEWRVYETGSPSGAFNPQSVGFGANATFNDPLGNTYANGGDQNWQDETFSVDVANGLVAGDYTLEIFFRTSTDNNPQFVNNGGANYTASFTVVPEPATIALFGLGFGGLMIARRRRA